jgi:hypothetical protein
MKFWSHSSDATSTPMPFMEELVLKVNLEDPFFTRRYAPKCWVWTIPKRLMKRQFNFIQFNEASMQDEDFGKALTIKVLFRGEQRWRRFMHSHSLQVSKLYSI